MIKIFDEILLCQFKKAIKPVSPFRKLDDTGVEKI